MEKLKQILQNEIKRHSREIERHLELSDSRGGSKKQKRKARKHCHKRDQVILIAEKMEFDFCECCGRLR